MSRPSFETRRPTNTSQGAVKIVEKRSNFAAIEL
jgi:hypothetical protein